MHDFSLDNRFSRFGSSRFPLKTMKRRGNAYRVFSDISPSEDESVERKSRQNIPCHSRECMSRTPDKKDEVGHGDEKFDLEKRIPRRNFTGHVSKN